MQGRSLFGGGQQGAGMPPLGASPAELEKGEAGMPMLNIQVQDRRMAALTEEDIGRQMQVRREDSPSLPPVTVWSLFGGFAVSLPLRACALARTGVCRDAGRFFTFISC